MRSPYLLKKLQLVMLIARDREVSRCWVATAAEIINAYNFDTGKCFPSFSYIAKLINYSTRQVKKSIKGIVPKYILKLSKGHTGWANTYKPRFELLKELKSHSSKDLKVVNFEVVDSELETYNPVNPTALQTINKKINEKRINLTRLKNLAVLKNKGINLISVSQVEEEIMDKMGLLDKK